jgi:hypothetical protein
MIFNADSITNHIHQLPLEPAVALTYFFTQQQRHIMALDEYDDPTLQNIYKTAYLSFSVDRAVKKDTNIQMQVFCDATASQFQKIIRCNNEDTPASKKRLQKYAEDGKKFAQRIKRRCSNTEESPTVTPLEETAKSADLAFVETYREQNQGKMDWTSCFQQGRDVNLFDRYSSQLTLKMAYHRHTL